MSQDSLETSHVFWDSVTDDRQSSSGIWEVNLITSWSSLSKLCTVHYINVICSSTYSEFLTVDTRVSICILEQTGTARIWMTDKSELNTLHRIHRSIILYYIFSIFNSKCLTDWITEILVSSSSSTPGFILFWDFTPQKSIPENVSEAQRLHAGYYCSYLLSINNDIDQQL